MHDSISSSALCALLGVRRQSTRNSDRTFCFLNRRRFQPAWERAYLVGSAAAACATPPPVRKHRARANTSAFALGLELSFDGRQRRSKTSPHIPVLLA